MAKRAHHRQRGAVPRSATLWLAAVVVVASLSAPVRGLTFLQAGPEPREPLAMKLGLVDVPRSRDAAPRTDDPPQLFLRLPPDEFINALMDSTSEARMVATMQRLEDFGTRYVVTDSCWAAGYWIGGQFESLGYETVRFDTFRTMSFQDSVETMNVLAVKEGTTRPDEYVVIGGHYDSVSILNFSDPDALAPGVDDNGTAVAAVFEAARLLKNVPTDRSVIFACWSAEEVGLWGSRAFVADAVADSMNIIVYINMDCLGYLDPGVDLPPVTVYTDSLSRAIAGYMETLAERTPYEFQSFIQPLGASDHTSFWEARYNVVDTGTTVASPYRHTHEDVLENINPSFARDLAAVNIGATAAIAGIVGEDSNLPPETMPIATCASGGVPVTMRPTFEWWGVDFDGAIDRFEYAVDADIDRGNGRPTVWKELPAWQTSITLDELSVPGTYVFRVRAYDDEDVVDPTPARYEFTASDTLWPRLKVVANFLPEERIFSGPERPGGDDPVTVYEGERLVMTVSGDAGFYCGAAESVAVALGGATARSELVWHESPHVWVVRPASCDSLLLVATRDENGATTSGSVALDVVPAPMDRPLLRVDDWLTGSVPEFAHDAFYETALAGESLVTWDPLEHIENYVPTLPSMEELGRYRTVLWTLDSTGGFLSQMQGETAYHYLEGFVRAGGNLLLEGQSSLMAMTGSELWNYPPTYAAGDFIHDHVGVDSLRNSGTNDNHGYPDLHGYAFLGGMAEEVVSVDAPVDTLVKWVEEYQEHGGLPLCEIARPLDGTKVLYRFDSYINEALEGHPCATARFPADGTGSVVWFGFPLYYIEDAHASQLLDDVLAAVRAWQKPARLASFDWAASPDSVLLTWRLEPPDDAMGCVVQRKAAAGNSVFATVSDTLRPGAGSLYAFTDLAIDELESYDYRLIVVERWGGTTRYGPWRVDTPGHGRTPWLASPFPNPFDGRTTIRYGVPGGAADVSVRVYDVAGRLVAKLDPGRVVRGVGETTWDGADSSGEPVASGVYFVRARVGGTTLARKLVLLRGAN